MSQSSIAMHTLLERQQAAHLVSAPPSAAARRAALLLLQRALRGYQDRLIGAMSADFSHRSAQESVLGDMLTTGSAIQHLERHLTRWMKPERRSVPLHFKLGRAWVESQPLGVVGVIAPWNIPVGLGLVPLATAIAAGNRVMLKPSEYTPATAALLDEMLRSIFPSDQVAVVTGGAEIGAAFAGLPFNLICFTGSTSVGRTVMRAASEHLVPVILELGGKSPAIVDEDYPLERAARSVAHAKLANAGQTCIAPDYALVPATRLDAFVRQIQRQAAALYPAWASNPDYCAIINQQHHARLTALIEDARARGATIIEMVPGGATPANPAIRRFPPTIITGVTDEMMVMQDEIFGPILPVRSYTTLPEAIGYVNAHPRPLALYYFGNDRSRQEVVLTETTSGGVTINDTMLHYFQDSLPFGGVGSSGMGSYHGIEGFRNFSHRKAVFRQGRFNATDLLRPPYGKRFDQIVRRLLS